MKGIDVLMTPIVERAAYRDLFEFGGGLKDQDPKTVTNLDKARDNAAMFAAEILERAEVQQRRRWYHVFKKASVSLSLRDLIRVQLKYMRSARRSIQ